MPPEKPKSFPDVPLPVLMYHSVGREIQDWRWPDLTVPAAIFDDHLKWISRAGYRTVGLDDLYAHTTGEKILPRRSIVLTFDDGYIDNWTYAVPLMERYGFTGTVLVTPEFVEPGGGVRPTLKDVWDGRLDENDLEVRGFMSWEELDRAVRSGTLSVQSHAMTHTWYATGDTVVDFHHPGDGRYWLDWNANPDKKPFYLRDPEKSAVPAGTPVYEHAKSLAATRYFPDPRETDFILSYVRDNGAESYFKRAGWKEKLFEVLDRYREEHPPKGRFETEEERLERIRYELVQSKKEIENRLGTDVDFFIWPGGGYDEVSMAAAAGVYRAVTIRSQERMDLRNRPGEAPGRIVRRGIPGADRNGRVVYYGGRYMLEFIREFEGSALARKRRQVMKLFFLAAGRIGLWPGTGSPIR
jgi:peptidoglycan/xylan/chitin deacetylase (PgdA/CDA1 family)